MKLKGINRIISKRSIFTVRSTDKKKIEKNVPLPTVHLYGYPTNLALFFFYFLLLLGVSMEKIKYNKAIFIKYYLVVTLAK